MWIHSVWVWVWVYECVGVGVWVWVRVWVGIDFTTSTSHLGTLYCWYSSTYIHTHVIYMYTCTYSVNISLYVHMCVHLTLCVCVAVTVYTIMATHSGLQPCLFVYVVYFFFIYCCSYTGMYCTYLYSYTRRYYSAMTKWPLGTFLSRNQLLHTLIPLTPISWQFLRIRSTNCQEITSTEKTKPKLLL